MADENKENIQEPAADPAKTEQAALVEQEAPNSNNKHHARSKSPPQTTAGPPTLHTSNRQSTGPTRFNRDIVRDEARKIHLGNRSHHEKLDDSVGQNIERLLLLSKVAHPSYSIPYKQLLAEVEENENKVFTQVPKALTPRTGRAKRSGGLQDSVGPRVQTRNDDYAEYVKQRRPAAQPKPIVEKDKPLTKPNASQIWKAASRSKFMDPTLYEKPEGAVTRREEIAMRREKATEKQQQILAASRPAQSASFAPKPVATAKVPDAKNFVPACAERTPADHGESARKERAEHAKAKKSGFRF